MASAQKVRSSTTKSTAWQTYQAAVLARTDLTTDDKLVFVELTRVASHKTGANCWPALSDVAERYGKSVQWVSRAVRHLKAHGIIEAIPLRSHAGRWKRNGYRFVGHGFVGPHEFGRLKHLKPSEAPRRVNQAHDRATGRFTNGLQVTNGDGLQVTNGAGMYGLQVTNQALVVSTAPVVAQVASATAPEATNLAEATSTSVDRTTASAFETFWMSQLDDDQKAQLRSALEDA